MRNVFVLLFGILLAPMWAQPALDFEEEVEMIGQRYDTIWEKNKETVVFTGSSSIRLWKDLETLFPEYQIVNTGFGGSRAADLLAFTDELILRYHPKIVFIYEGDNDLFFSESPRKILKTTRMIIEQIQQQNPDTRIVLIAAKPSIQRWHMRGRFKKLNKKLRRLSESVHGLEFANIWHVMLEGKKVNPELFIEDGLHMNDKGYILWYDVIKAYLK
jgi:lysophospholipase L1-like esterase